MIESQVWVAEMPNTISLAAQRFRPQEWILETPSSPQGNQGCSQQAIRSIELNLQSCGIPLDFLKAGQISHEEALLHSLFLATSCS